MNIFEQLSLAGLVPVIKVNKPEQAVPLCKALADGGLPVAEITFRTDAAEEAIRLVHEALPEVLLGAGTVLTCDQADRAWNAGAGYIVAPGLNPEVVKHCIAKGYPVLPGVGNPSDIEIALSLGLKQVKFFPAEALGGIKAIKAMSGPYGDIKFVPTGGINTGNLNEYLDNNKIVACGGSWVAPIDLIEAGEFDKIEKLAEDAVKLMLGFKLRHVGINSKNEEEATKTAKTLCAIFGLKYDEHNVAIFAGKEFEVMKSKGRGELGHIAIETNNVDRAMWHLERKGIKFVESTIKKNSAGKTTIAYLEEEIGGFAFHLLLNK